jgi:uncharacterized delta-60 repeat protein
MKATALGIILSILLSPIIGTTQIRRAPLRPSVVAAAGDLDPTFGTGGKVTTDIQGDFDKARAVAIQADGKIVVAGSALNGANIDFAVLRYNTDGSLDTTFGTGGKVLTPVLDSDDLALAVAIQPDGKIVAAGLAVTGADDIAVVRYNTDGTLDTTFDGDGKATFSILVGFNDIANAVAIQPDGKIVLAGSTNNGSDDDFAVIRLNPNGSLDSTFNAIGISTFAILDNDDVANAVVLQPDGKIVIAGFTDNGQDTDFAAARLNPNGSLDLSFGVGGKVSSGVKVGDDIGTSAALQADGKIVVAGYGRDSGSDTDFAAVRYNTNGSLDNTFDTDGKVTTKVKAADDFARSVAIEPDGKIVIAGETDNGLNLDFAVVRLNTDGSLDTSFGPDGTLSIDFQNSSDQGFGVALQSDGKIVVIGDSDVGTVHEIGLIRLDGGIFPTTMQFSSPTYTGTESRTATITVTRTGDASGTSTVQYATSDGTATGGTACSVVGSRFVTTSGTLTFNPTDISKTFPVTLCSDLRSENPAETINLTLSSPVNGTLGLSTATLKILDAATQFVNDTPILLTDGLPGSPYPSTINVSGPAVISGLRLSLLDVTKATSNDLTVMLVDPSGTRNLIFMANTGGANPLDHATITFEDVAPSFLPFGTPIVEGQNYKPTDCLGDSLFPSPAPPAPHNQAGCSSPAGTFASAFGGINPNGAWSLYVIDELGADLRVAAPDSIGGWGIQFLTPTAARASLSGRVRLANGSGISGAVVTVSGGDLQQPLQARTSTFGYYTFSELTSGQAYVVTASARRYTFSPRFAQLFDDMSDFDLVADR